MYASCRGLQSDARPSFECFSMSRNIQWNSRGAQFISRGRCAVHGWFQISAGDRRSHRAHHSVRIFLPVAPYRVGQSAVRQRRAFNPLPTARDESGRPGRLWFARPAFASIPWLAGLCRRAADDPGSRLSRPSSACVEQQTPPCHTLHREVPIFRAPTALRSRRDECSTARPRWFAPSPGSRAASCRRSCSPCGAALFEWCSRSSGARR
jgi:hypothetical protein